MNYEMAFARSNIQHRRFLKFFNLDGMTMIKKFCLTFSLVCIFFCGQAFAASFQPGAAVSISVPDGWNTLENDFAMLAHPSVNHYLNCLDTDASELKQVGWLLDGNSLHGAYCISFRQSGMAKALNILKTGTEKERKAAADKLADTFAGIMQAGYNKRGITLEGLTAHVIDSGPDVVMILDGVLNTSFGEFMRSETVFIHDDSMLSIGSVYAAKNAGSVAEQLESVPLSVRWK